MTNKMTIVHIYQQRQNNQQEILSPFPFYRWTLYHNLNYSLKVLYCFLLPQTPQPRSWQAASLLPLDLIDWHWGWGEGLSNILSSAHTAEKGEQEVMAKKIEVGLSTLFQCSETNLWLHSPFWSCFEPDFKVLEIFSGPGVWSWYSAIQQDLQVGWFRMISQGHHFWSFL